MNYTIDGEFRFQKTKVILYLDVQSSQNRETLRENRKNVYFKRRAIKCVCKRGGGGGKMLIVFDRHIRLQKEHPARGWGHMVQPSAGVALDQVPTLAQGHDCLRFVPSVPLF